MSHCEIWKQIMLLSALLCHIMTFEIQNTIFDFNTMLHYDIFKIINLKYTKHYDWL